MTDTISTDTISTDLAPAPAATSSTAHSTNPDPRDVFLTARQVCVRYRWKQTQGFAKLKDPTFPRPLDGLWRLDVLHAHEEAVMRGEVPSPTAAAGNATRAGRAQAQLSARVQAHAGPAVLPASRRKRRAA